MQMFSTSILHIRDFTAGTGPHNAQRAQTPGSSLGETLTWIAFERLSLAFSRDSPGPCGLAEDTAGTIQCSANP